MTRLTLLYRKPGYEIGDVLRWRDKLWRAASWTKEGAIMSRIDRQERTGASWRDLESANVMTQMGEHNIVDLITQDASVGEFLDPSTWQMTSVRLPWDYLKTRPLRVTQVDGEWVALHHLGCDEKEARVKK